MLAVRLYPPSTLRIEEVPRPEPGPGEILVRTEVCGLCGSDVAKFQFGRAAAGEVLGHEVAGTVESLGPEPSGRFAVGDRVVVAHHAPCFDCHYCRRGSYSMCRTFKLSALEPGGFAEFFVASRAHVAHTAFPIPEALRPEAATFMEPLACTLKAAPRLNLHPGDLALVFGLGPMGILFGRLLAARGARVVGIDPRRDRRARVGTGFEATYAPDDPELGDRVRGGTDGRGADAAVLVAGRGAVAAAAIPLVREGAAVCLFAASPEDSSVSLPLDMMYYGEVTLFGSYSPAPDGFAEALDLLSRGAVAVDDLISHRLPLGETARAFEMALRGEGMKIMIRPGGRANPAGDSGTD